MTMSFKYKCPPGTGTPKELKATFTAISIAVTVIQRKDVLLLNVVCGFVCVVIKIPPVCSRW